MKFKFLFVSNSQHFKFDYVNPIFKTRFRPELQSKF